MNPSAKVRMTLRHFWNRLLVWTAATVAMLACFNIVQWAVAPRSTFTLARYTFGVIEHLPSAFGLLLPFVAYAAAVAAGGRDPADRSMRTPLLAGAGVALLALLLVGFVAPFVERSMTHDSEGAIVHNDSGEANVIELGRIYVERQRELRSAGASMYHPLQYMSVNRTGWQFHARIAMSVMALLTTAFGFMVGRRVRPERGRWSLVEAWAIGLLLVGVTSLFVVVGQETSEQRNVSPAAMAWLPLFGPAVAVATLWWAGRNQSHSDAA